jgi:hypothetical protein
VGHAWQCFAGGLQIPVQKTGKGCDTDPGATQAEEMAAREEQPGF